MLTIVLRILSVIGILLLALFALAAVMLLLVLFVPVTYRISGAKNDEGFRISARVKWLLGLVRLRYGYPEPGELTAKLLFFTLYRMKMPSGEEESANDKAANEKSAPDENAPGEKKEEKASADKSHRKITVAHRKKKDNPESGNRTPGPKENRSGSCPGENTAGTGAGETGEDGRTESEKVNTPEAGGGEGDGEALLSGESAEEKNPGKENEAVRDEQPSNFGKILQKFEKFKYTIHGIYDKIKEIWNNISYYLELLQEEETRQLFSHIMLRTGKSIKSVCPRHIRADILFGTGSPDTTGYLYGAYCMISPVLKADVCVTPDFERAVLEADFDISGRITVWVLAVNACRIALDKRLRRLIRKAVSPGLKGKENRMKAA